MTSAIYGSVVLAPLFLLALLAQAPDADVADAGAPELVMLPDGGLPPLTDGTGLPRFDDAGAAPEPEERDAGAEPAPAQVDQDLGEDTPEPALHTELPPVATAAPGARLRVAASHALVGRFAANTCAQPIPESPFERLSARVAGAMDTPGAAPTLFDTGDLLGTSAIGRLAVETDVVRLAEAVAALGFRARALGHRDLAGDRKRLLELTRALDERAVRSVLTNLSCSAETRALCDAVVTGSEPPLMIDTPEGRVGFIAAISPGALREVGRHPGLILTAPAGALAAATRQARALGANRVVAVYAPATGTELDDATELLKELDAASSPDVLFVSGLSSRFTSALTASGNTLLVATRPAEVLTVELGDGHAHTVQLPTLGTPSPVVAAFARDLNHALCGRYEAPFAGGRLQRELDRETAATFVLDVMREHTRAEVAIINTGAVSSNAPWPLRGALSPLDVMQMLPFDNTLRTTRLKGSALVALLGSDGAKSFFVRGAAKEDSGWKINGRAIDTNQHYALVTTDFLADRLTDELKEAPPFAATGASTVRELVTRWLSVAREGDILRQPINPAERSRWTLSYRLQLDLTNVSVTNPDTAIFTDTQLARGQSLSLVGETEFRAIGDHPAWSLESTARLRYGMVRTVPLGGTANGIANNVDLVTLRNLGYVRRIFGEPKWYLPRPYADVYVESELTRPETRRYHHLQLLPQGGVRFELTPTFAVYAGGGMTWEVFAQPGDLTPPVPPAAGVLVGGWQLRPTQLVKLGARSVELESNLDIFARDLGGPTQLQARGRVLSRSSRSSRCSRSPPPTTCSSATCARKSAARGGTSSASPTTCTWASRWPSGTPSSRSTSETTFQGIAWSAARTSSAWLPLGRSLRNSR